MIKFMPQVLIKNFCKHSFLLWQINENLSDLIKILNPSKSELSEINSHKTLKRRKQNICSRILLNLISNKKTILRYDEFGKPFCENFKFISISHSDNFCGIVTSNENIGLDIQKKKTNIEKLSSRFVSPGERLVKFNNEIDKIHYIWCFKESIYKILNHPNCSFKKNIYTEKFKRNKIYGFFKNKSNKTNFEAFSKKIDDYYITIASIK